MSVKNRNEIATQVTTKIVPEVDNATHIDLLNNNIVNSMLTRKDVINAAVPVGGALTVDYSEGDNTDLATATLTQSTAVTFTGLENGDVKYLKITKAAGYAITFVGATNESDSQEYIDTLLTSILYAVYQKNGVNHARAVTKSLLESTESEFLSKIAYKYITPAIFIETWKEVGNDGGVTSKNSPYDNVNCEFFYRRNGNDLDIWIKKLQPSIDTAVTKLFQFDSGFYKSYIETIGFNLALGTIGLRQAANDLNVDGLGQIVVNDYGNGAGVGFFWIAGTDGDLDSGSGSYSTIAKVPLDLTA